MPPPPVKTLASYLQDSQAQRSSIISSLTSGLWSVVTLGLASSNSNEAETNLEKTNSSTQEKQKPLVTFLPNLPTDASNANSSYIYDAQIDCSSRLLAWQSCHLLLVLVNHCTSESLYNPYRLALFHFTDTQGKHLVLIY